MNYKKVKLGGITKKIFSGGTPSTKNPKYWNGELLWLSSGETRNPFITNTERKITQEGVDHSSTRLAKEGDVVIASAGQGNTRGQVSYLQKDMYINQSIISIRTDKKFLDSLYLFYNLSSRYKELRIISEGNSIRGSLTTKIISELELSLPPLSEQKRISSILSSFDNKIEQLRKENNILEDIAQNIFKEWFIKYNFPNKDGKPYKDNNGKMIDSELGEIPEGWKVGKFGDTVKIFDSERIPLSKKEREQKKGKYPYYGATGIMDYVDEYLFDGKYLLLAEDGSVQTEKGYPVLQLVDDQFWVNNHAHILQGKPPFSTEYLYLLMKKSNITNIITGAVQPKINQTNLLKFPVLIPKENILKSFVDKSTLFFERILKNKYNIKILKKARASLLNKLIS
jgi:type I restriction enzyme S subunit